MNKVLVIDNYDSFTYNLSQMFIKYNLKIEIYRHDQITINDIKKKMPNYIIISPGPRSPTHTGISLNLIKNFYSKIPILGICLGMQCINEFFGGKTVRYLHPIHGKSTNIYHTGKDLFHGIPSPFKGARYHSLITKKSINISKNILITNAWSSDGIIMSISHPNLPIYGLQFHPESFLTDYGFKLIENFIKIN